MADAEVILLAAESISELGIKDLSVDINVPSMARMICEDLCRCNYFKLKGIRQLYASARVFAFSPASSIEPT